MGELYHYGVKGMKWGKRKRQYAVQRSRTTMIPETDTGTRASTSTTLPTSSVKSSIAEQLKAYNAKKQQDAEVRRLQNKNRQQQSVIVEKTKEKSSSKKAKSQSSKKKEETKKQKEVKTENQKSLPEELVNKLKDPNVELTSDEVRQRSSDGVNKAKELLSKLPDNPTEEDIKALWDLDSNEVGKGYDAFSIELAIDTATIVYCQNRIDEIEKNTSHPVSEDGLNLNGINYEARDSKELQDLYKKKAACEFFLKEAIKTGRCQW